MFTTSVNGTGDLATWADSGGQSGLAGADAVCRSRAAAAGLANSQSFVAWLSDSIDDAFCRVQGHAGKKAANCGQATLPTGGGGWVRTDGYPFTPNLEALTFGGTLTPPWLDEFGNQVDIWTNGVFTGTEYDGQVDPDSDTCANWTSDSGSLVGREGRYFTTWVEWTRAGVGICQFPRPIYCFEVAQVEDPEPPPIFGAIAFFLNRFGDGSDVGSVANGDALCRTWAAAGGLPEPDSYLAWLSDNGHDAIDRFSFDGPWIRPDGVLVAQDKADLTDGFLHAPINQDYLGTYVGKSVSPFGTMPHAWTGTAPTGERTGANCQQWTSADRDDLGAIGRPEYANQTWTQRFDLDGPFDDDCESRHSFYCFSQIATGPLGRLFHDGFESGNTVAWSSSVP